jgi:hypothetical protein
MITNAGYNFPLGIPGGYFNGKAVPPYPDYLRDYHVHFMRYIYYMCIMNAEGNYPNELSIEDILNGIELNKGKKCKPRIKKILIGEAPPPNPLNYFYNPSPLRWNATTSNPSLGQSWTSTIKNTLFPGILFPNTVSFLEACAREGFLLLDLFPYNLNYNGTRTSGAYKIACISAFGFGAAPYLHNILNTLDDLICCIQKRIAFGFALKSFGEVIITDTTSVSNFNLWCTTNGIILNPIGPLDQIRVVPPPVRNASDYLRVCGRRYLLSPCKVLLNLAGF